MPSLTESADVTARPAPVRRSAACWVATSWVLAFHLPLLDGGVPSGFDVVHEKYFWREWTFGRLAHGELPLWNPHVLAGYPMYADPVQGLFYPLNWIHLALPTGLSIGISFALAGLIGCWGAMSLARLLGAESWGAALAGMAYATGGFVSGHVALGEIPHLQSTAWTPWVFAFALEGLAGRDQAWPRLSIAVALAILAGHVQYAYQTLVGLGILVATSCTLAKHPRGTLKRIVLGLVPATSLGISLAAIILIPALAFVKSSNRAGGLDWIASTSGAIHPLELLRAVVPDFFGDAVRSPYWGGFLKEASTPYVGVLPLLALPFAFARRAARDTIPVAVVGLFGIAIALSAYTPIHHLIYASLPGFAYFRLPVRWLHLTVLTLAVLGGVGASTAFERGSRPSLRAWHFGLPAALTASVLLVIQIVIFSHSTSSSPDSFARLERYLHARVDSILGPDPEAMGTTWAADRTARFRFAADANVHALGWVVVGGIVLALAARGDGRQPGIGILLLGLAAADLGLAGGRYLSTVSAHDLVTPAWARSILDTDTHARTLTLLPATAIPQTPAFRTSYPLFNRWSQSHMHRAMLEDRRDLGGVFFVVPSAYRALLGITTSFEHETVTDLRTLDALGARWVMAPAESWPTAAPPRAGLIERGEADGLQILENRSYLPRAWLARRIALFDDATSVRADLLDPSTEARSARFLRSDLAQDDARWLAGLASAGGDARVVKDGDEILEVTAESPTPALLVIADSFDTGWRAEIDGSPQPILRANLSFRAVRIPAGSSRVTFRYRPRPLVWGALVTACAVIAVTAWWRRLPGRADPPPTSSGPL